MQAATSSAWPDRRAAAAHAARPQCLLRCSPRAGWCLPCTVQGSAEHSQCGSDSRSGRRYYILPDSLNLDTLLVDLDQPKTRPKRPERPAGMPCPAQPCTAQSLVHKLRCKRSTALQQTRSRSLNCAAQRRYFASNSILLCRCSAVMQRAGQRSVTAMHQRGSCSPAASAATARGCAARPRATA